MKTILLYEPDEAFRDNLKEILYMAGYDVKFWFPDLAGPKVLMDYPVISCCIMNGKEWQARVRIDPALFFTNMDDSEVPIIVYCPDIDDLSLCRANWWIQLPFDSAQLLVAIEKVMKQQKCSEVMGLLWGYNGKLVDQNHTEC